MITLALNPANTELAFLIDQIEHGETVTVTKNGQPVAQILPFTRKLIRKRPSRLLAQFALAYNERNAP